MTRFLMIISIILLAFSCDFINPFNPEEIFDQKENFTAENISLSSNKFYKIINVNNNMLLTTTNFENGTFLTLNEDISNDFQLWTFYNYHDAYVIVNKLSTKVVDVNILNKMDDGAKIYQCQYYSGYPDQYWDIKVNAINQYKLTNVTSGFVLAPINDFVGTNLIQTAYNESENQKWKIIEVE